jgi:hypothetical protein
MTIRREDLAAAAALGLLQYRQVDPLLVFLLQRDVHARRLALLREREQRHGGILTFMSYVAGGLATVALALFALLLSTRSAELGPGVAALLLLASGGCALVVATLARARGYGRGMRLAGAALIGSVPLLVFALNSVA